MAFNPLEFSTHLSTDRTSIELPNSKTVVQWNGKIVKLGDPQACFEKYGVYPGIILRDTSNKCFKVKGIGKEDGLLWVKSIESCALIQVKGQENLKEQGYNPTEPLNEKYSRKRKLACDDSHQVIECMAQIFATGVGCDVIFKIGEAQIKGHAAFLIARSEYFKGLLEGHFQEGIPSHDGNPKIITLSEQEYDAEGFRIILAYLYTGSITINRENISKVATLADRYRIPQLLDYCNQLLPQILKPEEGLTLFQELFKVNFFLQPSLESYLYCSYREIFKKDQKTIQSLSKDELKYLIEKAPNPSIKIDFFHAVLIWLTQQESMPERIKDVSEEIFALFPKDDKALFEYGKILSLFISTPQANEKFKTTLTLVSKDHWISIIYAEALCCLDSYAEARDKFFGVHPSNPAYHFACLRYPYTLQKDGDLQGAKGKYEEFLLTNPQNPFALGEYAQTLRLLGEKILADQKFQEALALDATNMQALIDYGYFLSLQGQMANAMKYFEKAMAIDPQNKQAYSGYQQTKPIEWTIG